MIEVTIEKLVYGGKGLARHEGRVLFIPGVLPGERVRVEIRRKRKGFLEAELQGIVTPSPDRIVPPCRGNEECTGAHWPFIAYPAQLRFKEEILLETLKKIGKVEPKVMLPIIPSPDRDHYRLRVQLNVRYEGSRPRLGFFREGTRDLVEIRNGYLLHPLIDRAIEAIREIAERLPPLREIHINASPGGEVLILFFIEMESPPSLSPLFESLHRAMKEIVGVVAYAVRERWEISGRNFILSKLDGLVFRSTEGNFFQVNWAQNRNLIQALFNLAGLGGDERVLDLYCGTGNLSLHLARRCARVIGIESGLSAVEDARKNAEANGIANCEFICDDCRKGLKGLLGKEEKADLIVLDPPRAGATRKIIERIMAFSPRKILYVSCNPTTLARDLEMFHEGGYTLDRLQPIDMFPQTYHIEAIAELNSSYQKIEVVQLENGASALLPGEVAAVDRVIRARDERGLVGAQPDDELGHLFGFTQPADRVQCDELLPRLRVLLEVGDHGRSDEPRSDRVHADATASIVDGRTLGEADDGVFGAHIGGGPGERHPSEYGGDVDDRPSARFQHGRDLVFHAVEDTGEVDGDQPLPPFDAVVRNGVQLAGDAGVVASIVEPSEPIDRRLDEPLAFRGDGDIRPDEMGLAAG